MGTAKLNNRNILMITSLPNRGNGGQESLFNLATHFTRNEFSIQVLVPMEGGLSASLREHMIPVHLLGLPKVNLRNTFKVFTALLKLLCLMVSNKIDLVHTDNPRNTFYAGLAAKIIGIPLVWHIRASKKDRFDRLLYKMSSKIILVANALKSRFDWAGDLNKAVTIYNGVDLSEFEPKGGYKKIELFYPEDSIKLNFCKKEIQVSDLVE